MRTVFADTFYLLATFYPADAAHVRAKQLTAELRGVRLLTTSWVLTEFADAACSRADRQAGAAFIRRLQSRPNVTVVPPTDDLFTAGLTLYESRPDKDWSLTDCVSFVVMERQGVAEVLTGDRHFAQAGFRPLFD